MLAEANGFTAEQIAALIGISPRAVHKKAGIEAFISGQIVGRGRPVALYTADALSLWGATQPQAVEAKQRRPRADRGRSRSCSEEQWNRLVQVVLGFYLQNAQANLRIACEQTVRHLRASDIPSPLTHQQIYKRLTYKGGSPGATSSEFYRDGWEILHRSKWRKKDLALEMPTRRFDWPAIWESAGWAGPGKGALRGWSIDVRTADAWSRRLDAEMSLPAAIYIRCCLTGYPIWVEPIESESSDNIIRAVLKAMLAWGRSPDICIMLDNGKAMIAERTIGVLESMLPMESWDRAAMYPDLFGAGASPIMRNLPNIPCSRFKGALERSFRLIKDEFDATRMARTYQGGSRQEAVQLRVSNRPSYEYLPPSVISTTEGYFSGLGDWLYSDYVHRERPAMHGLLKRRGITPTIATAFEYYYDSAPALPIGEQIAHLLYWATERRAQAKAHLGYVDVMINGEYWHCLSSELDHRMYGHQIAVLPIPRTNYAILIMADDPANPRYIDTARNAFIRSMDDLHEVTPIARDVQNTVRDRLRDARGAVELQTWENTQPAAMRPSLPAAVSAAFLDGTPLGVAECAHDDNSIGGDSIDAPADDRIDGLIGAADDIWQ